MKSVLDTEISLFKDYSTSDNPVTINMLSFIKSTKYAERVDEIRTVEDKKRRNELKATLPAITPSGVFSYRAEKDLVKHSGLLQFDIDSGADNWEELKEELAHLDYVSYAGLSVSGRGLWGLIPLAYPNRHKQQFGALEIDFAGWGITLDIKPKNVASLRGYSYDGNAYYNHEAVLYEKCYEPPKIELIPVPKDLIAPVGDPFQVAARTLEKQGIIYQQGNRHAYLWQFARLCNRFGVDREECKAYVDSTYGYDEPTNWIDSYKRYGHEQGTYASTVLTTQQPTKPQLPPGHKLETITLPWGQVTNEINAMGYPASWDN